MAEYGIISGAKSNLVADRIMATDSSISITRVWKTISDLKQELFATPSAILDSLNSVILTDIGFSKSSKTVKDKALEFIALQDLLSSKNFENMKLNLVTTNVSLHEELLRGLNGTEGITYINAEMFLQTKNPTVKVLSEIYLGKLDRTGTFNPDVLKKDRLTQARQSSQAIIDEAKTLSDDVLKFGEDVPTSTKDATDYSDSPVSIRKREEAEKQRVLAERKALSESRRANKGRGKVNTANLGKEGLQKPLDMTGGVLAGKKSTRGQQAKQRKTSVGIDNEAYKEVKGTPIARNNSVVSRKNTVPSEGELRELFGRLDKADNDTIEQKLISDRGVISVISPEGMGGSGFVAQSAEMYAMLGLKVLIIDLDIERRTQTLYYPNYAKAVKLGNGSERSLIRVSQGGDIKPSAVSVTSRIDILSIARDIEYIKSNFNQTISTILPEKLAEARNDYDIILLDLPLTNLKYHLRNIDMIDRNIFVLENKAYSVEDFFSIQLFTILEDREYGEELFAKSSIVLNKFNPTYRNSEGYQISKYFVKELLIQAGKPFDRINIAGELPFYDVWEDQYHRNIRYIWEDDLALSLYRNIYSRVM